VVKKSLNDNKREEMMKFKKYLMGILAVGMMAGCTSKDTIPPMPPKDKASAKIKVRTYEEMENKLSSLRKPINGTQISKQKREASKEINTLLKDAKKYKRKVSAFEKAHPVKIKSSKKRKYVKVHKPSKKHGNSHDENQLKYY